MFIVLLLSTRVGLTCKQNTLLSLIVDKATVNILIKRTRGLGALSVGRRAAGSGGVQGEGGLGGHGRDSIFTTCQKLHLLLNLRHSILGKKCKDGDRYPLVGPPSNLEMILKMCQHVKEVLPFVLVIRSLFIKFRGIGGLLSVFVRKIPHTPLTKNATNYAGSPHNCSIITATQGRYPYKPCTGKSVPGAHYGAFW